MIRFAGVSFAYRQGEPVLDGVDLELGAGLTLLVGPNGCGKSTLLKLAAGVEEPDGGRIFLSGHDLAVEEVAARQGLAYVPEQPDLTPYATVGEIVRLVCRLRGEPVSRAVDALERAGVGALARRSVRELSMGQRRRAVLAAAFVGEPRIVLLDEPLEAMDQGARGTILEWIDGLLAMEAAVVVVSHDLDPFRDRAARFLSVQEGRAAVVTPPGEPAARAALLERLARGGAGALASSGG